MTPHTENLLKMVHNTKGLVNGMDLAFEEIIKAIGELEYGLTKIEKRFLDDEENSEASFGVELPITVTGTFILHLGGSKYKVSVPDGVATIEEVK